MKKQSEKRQISNLLKTIIGLTFLLSVLSFGLLIDMKIEKVEYEYETIHVKLNNSNDFEYVDGEIIEYLCDENVEFTNHGDAYYASTVDISDLFYGDWIHRGYGECMIKIEKVINKGRSEQ